MSKVDFSTKDSLPPGGKEPLLSFIADDTWLMAYEELENTLDIVEINSEDFN